MRRSSLARRKQHPLQEWDVHCSPILTMNATRCRDLTQDLTALAWHLPASPTSSAALLHCFCNFFLTWLFFFLLCLSSSHHLLYQRDKQPTPVFLSGEFHGQRSLVGYTPQGCKESDTAELLTHTYTHAVSQLDNGFYPLGDVTWYATGVVCVCACVCMCVHAHVCTRLCLVTSDSLQPYGLYPTRLCPWDPPGENTGVGCHFLLQVSSPPREQTHISVSPALAGRVFLPLSHVGAG